MIPVHLTLRNFLSYREPAELDFAGIHLACISGPNGAGKSTILDAITWALFGKSRVKSDDDIVNRAAAEKREMAEVGFTFELEGAIYRVIRRKAPGKTTELEFHARVPEGDAERWQVMTEARIRETQIEIERLLRMNYEVFTNASFLLQGKADEFTTKTADRRKEILAEILGVSRWDDYKNLAGEQRKTTEAESTAVQRQLQEVEAELAGEEELRSALEAAEAEVATWTAERDRHDERVTLARKNKAMADQQREFQQRLSADLAEARRELERINAGIAQNRAQQDRYQALLDRREAVESAFTAYQEAERELADRQARAERHAAIAEEMRPLENAVSAAEAQLRERVRELELQRQRAEQAAAGHERLQTSLAAKKERRAVLEARQAEVAAAGQAWNEAQMKLKELAADRRVLEQEHIQLSAAANEMNTLREERAQYDASKSIAQETLQTTSAELAALVDSPAMLAATQAEQTNLKSEQKRLEDEADDLKARIAQLQDGGDSVCPVCGQPLSAEHRRTVLAQYELQLEQHREQFRRNRAALQQAAEAIPELERQVKLQTRLVEKRDSQQQTVTRMETRLQDIEARLSSWADGDGAARLAEIERRLADSAEQDALAAQVEQLKAAADESRQVGQELQQLVAAIAREETQLEAQGRVVEEWAAGGKPALDEATAQLAAGSFAAAEREKLAALAERAAVAGHDPAALQAAKAALAELAAAPEEHRQLGQADAAIAPLRDALADLEQRRERTQAQESDLLAREGEAAALLQQLQADVGDLPAAEAELRRLRERVVEANRVAGGARQRVEVLAVRREDEKRLSAQKLALARRASLLRQLEEACGRRGVQALLIEAALPEIEEYANQLLERLTGGDMRILFETQRAAKSKQDSVIETLEIRIADGSGERPYENYSGGEKFRINFAIRLALSQVLANRAGARLQTLVIDEGFGSQDPEGRQRLVEAINAIQSEFASILVITHIDELRDKFPARIDVEKGRSGSRLAVVMA